VLLVAEHDQHVVGSLIVAWDGWRGMELSYARRFGVTTRSRATSRAPIHQ